MIGNDGSLDVTYDQGDTWELSTRFRRPVYAIAVDVRKPYYVYGGLQDNGSGAAQSDAKRRYN
jgi:hypothetical protein